MGAAIYSWIKTGELKGQGSSISEGIGQGRVTGNLDGARIDDAFQIPDTEMLPILYDLLQNEGLLLGGSSGINVAGAIRLARQLGPGKTIVTVLCDSGSALSVEAVQSRVPEGQGPAVASLARDELTQTLCRSLPTAFSVSCRSDAAVRVRRTASRLQG